LQFELNDCHNNDGHKQDKRTSCGIAIGMYNYLAKTDYRVGEHVHIIGFDNIELARYTQPRLATIDYSKRKWGAIASEQLLKLIANKPVEHERIYVTLIEGESVQPI
jgi:LacI family transcriptional regulator